MVTFSSSEHCLNTGIEVGHLGFKFSLQQHPLHPKTIAGNIFVGFFVCTGECVNLNVNDESVNIKKILLFDINQLKQESFGIAKLLYVALPGFQHFDLNHEKDLSQ